MSRYVVDGNTITFNLANRTYPFPIEIVDRWHQLYVDEDLTIEAIAQIFGISRSDMASMFKAIALTKKSPSRAPWVIASRDNDELVEDTLSSMVSSFESKKNSKIIEEYKKLASEEVEHRRRLELIQAFSRENKPEAIEYCYKDPEDADAMIVICTDWHVGFKSRDFDLSVLKSRLDSYLSNIIDSIGIWSPSAISIYFLGDILDSPSGDMYPNQKREQDVFDHEQVVAAANICISFLQEIYKFKSINMNIHMISGNHGKVFENIMYEWVKSFLSNIMTFHICDREDVVICDNSVDGWTIFAYHGDKLNSPDKIKNIIDDVEIRSNQIFIQGHEHHYAVKEFGRNKYLIKSGSIVGGNYYAKSNGWNSSPSQAIIIVSGNSAIPLHFSL